MTAELQQADTILPFKSTFKEHRYAGDFNEFLAYQALGVYCKESP